MGLYNREPDADPNSARSCTGYVLTLGGFPLIWKSQLQTSIAMDTACAEYQALSTALQAFIPICEVLFEIADVVVLPPSLTSTIFSEVFEDNMATYFLANSQRLTARTRWYHVKWHHFWEYVRLNEDFPAESLCSRLGRTNKQGICSLNHWPASLLSATACSSKDGSGVGNIRLWWKVTASPVVLVRGVVFVFKCHKFEQIPQARGSVGIQLYLV